MGIESFVCGRCKHWDDYEGSRVCYARPSEFYNRLRGSQQTACKWYAEDWASVRGHKDGRSD